MPSAPSSSSSSSSFPSSFSYRLVLVFLATVISFLLSSPASPSSFVSATFVSTDFTAISSTGAEWETWLSKYHDWRCLYVYSTGGGISSADQRRVARLPPVYSDSGIINSDWAYDTVSEGIAYGMLLSAYANDQTVFDGLWNYAQANFLSTVVSGTPNCMHWHILATGEWVTDGSAWDCASDAELDMIFALLIAQERWGSAFDTSYHDAAAALNDVVLTNEVDGYYVLRYGARGGSSGGNWRTNPSYFATGYWQLFTSVFGPNDWPLVRAASYQTIAEINIITGDTGLVPDWSTSEGTQSVGTSYLYSWNAIRFPWRMAADLLWYNDTDAGYQCQLLVDHWNNNFATDGGIGVGEEYLSGGFTANTFSKTDLAFLSPAITCALFSSTALKDRIWAEMYSYDLTDYYKDSLYLLSYLFAIGRFELPSSLTSATTYYHDDQCTPAKYSVTINNYCTLVAPYEFHVEFIETSYSSGGNTLFEASTSAYGPWTTMSFNSDWGTPTYPSRWYQANGVGPYPIYVRAEDQLWLCPSCEGGDQSCVFRGHYADPSNTPSLSSSPSVSRTRSRSRSISRSRSASKTASNTATRSETPSWTPTISLTATRSNTATVSSTRTASKSTSASISRTPTVSKSLSSSPTRSETPSSSKTSSPTISESPSSTPTSSGSSSGTPTSSGTPSCTPTSSGTASSTPTSSGTPTSTPTSSVTASNTPSSSETPSVTPTFSETPSRTPTISETPSVTPTHSETASSTPSLSETPSNTPTASETPSSTLTASSTPSSSPSQTGTPSGTLSASVSSTPSNTQSASLTTSSTPSSSSSETVTPSNSQTALPSNTRTGSVSISLSPSASRTKSASSSRSLSRTRSPSASKTRSVSPSKSRSIASGSKTRTVSVSKTRGSPSKSKSPSVSRSRSVSRTRTRTKSSPSRTLTRSRTATKSSPSKTRSRTRSRSCC